VAAVSADALSIQPYLSHTLVAWNANDFGATLRAINAVADPIQPTSGNDVFVLAQLPKLLGVYGVGANLTQLEVTVPSLRKPFLPDIEAFDVSATPVNRPALQDYFESPLPLEAGEGVRMAIADNGGANNQKTIFAWLGNQPVTPRRGDIRTLRVTGTTTLTTFTWTNVPLTLGQSIQSGNYEIVGLRARSAGALAARIVFPGGGPRPGVIATTTAGNIDHDRFRMGRMGTLGFFNSRFPPSLDFFSSTADTAETAYLEVIKVG